MTILLALTSCWTKISSLDRFSESECVSRDISTCMCLDGGSLLDFEFVIFFLGCRLRPGLKHRKAK